MFYSGLSNLRASFILNVHLKIPNETYQHGNFKQIDNYKAVNPTKYTIARLYRVIYLDSVFISIGKMLYNLLKHDLTFYSLKTKITINISSI